MVGGAYIGDQAVPLAAHLRHRGSGSTVHAFEPMAWAFERLLGNVDRNGLENVRCRRLGLSSAPADGLRLVGAPALASLAPAGAEDGEGVSVTSIDAYVEHEPVGRVGLVMLDLEGGEEEALRGAARTLARDAPPVVFEVHRDHVDWTHGLGRTPTVRGLLDAGYTVLAIRDVHGNHPLSHRPIELVPLDGVHLEGPPHGFNLLAISAADALLERPDVALVPGVSPKLIPEGDPALHHPKGGF